MLEKITQLAVEAGERILTFYAGEAQVTYKADQSPLTLADQASHDHISAGLTAAFPDIPIISEEGHVPSYSERESLTRFWLVDPLDGTKEFIKRNGEFTVNIALIEHGRPVLGVVVIPTKERVYAAARGQGAWLSQPGTETVRLTVNESYTLDDLAVSVSRSHPSGKLDEYLQGFTGVRLRPLGSSLKFCYIAEGRVDFYPRFGPLMEWDTAAAHVVVEESGAVVASLDGKPLRYNKPEMKHYGFIAAGSQALLDELLRRV